MVFFSTLTTPPLPCISAEIDPDKFLTNHEQVTRNNMPKEPRITRQTSGKLAPTQRSQATPTSAPCIGEELTVRWKGYD